MHLRASPSLGVQREVEPTLDGLRTAGGQGTVTEVELADEGDSGYEVEVRKDDGSYVEVALTDSFEVVSVEEDDD